MPLHFAFVDGALGYDCLRCGARCCHGLGFALPGAALAQLVEVAPGLGALVQLRGRGAFALTSADGCWALAEDKRCGIEVSAGYAAKPLVCRLFPLRARRIGGTLVVDLQLLACPLQPVDRLTPGVGVGRVTHAQAATELASYETEPLFDEVTPPRGAPDDIWTREAAARDHTAEVLATGGDALLACGAGPAELTLAQRWRRDLAVGPVAADWGRAVALCWPGLRLDSLIGPGAAPYPRQARRLPALGAAGIVLIELAATLPWPVGRGPQPTPRAVSELWRMQALHRELLLAWDEQVNLDGALTPGTPAPVAEAYATLAQRAATVSFGEAFAAAAHDHQLSASSRALLLRTAVDHRQSS